MIALLYAYLTRLGWRETPIHAASLKPRLEPYLTRPSAIQRTTMDIPMPNKINALMEEIRRLRVENAELRADLEDAKYRGDHDGY